MSCRVITPSISSDFYKIKARPLKPQKVLVAKLKKNLFGVVDREANKRFVKEELARQQRNASKKWGFDFGAGLPLENQTSFEWTCTVPTVITLTHAAHAIETSNDESEQLLDERAEKSEFYIHCDIPSPSRHDCMNKEIRGSGSTYSLRKLTLNGNKPSILSPGSNKRQPRITDFLKEKKKSIVSSASKKSPVAVKPQASLSQPTLSTSSSLRITMSQ